MKLYDKDYYGDEYDLMNAAAEYLADCGYMVDHVARRAGRKFKNEGAGKLDHSCRKGNIYFEIEYKNPNKKPDQWILRGGQINKFAELRAAGISHAVLNNIKDVKNFVAWAEKGQVFYYGGLKIHDNHHKYQNSCKNCNHQYIDAQGVGGGYIFKYCNICGQTKHI